MNKDIGMLVGRVLLALIFIITGWYKFLHFPGTVAGMAEQGIPEPGILLVFAIFIELGCGILLFAGTLARFAAFVIFLYVIPVTAIYHPFWENPQEISNFLKNLAVMGGLLYASIYGPGRFSFDPGFLNRLLWKLHGGR